MVLGGSSQFVINSRWEYICYFFQAPWPNKSKLNKVFLPTNLLERCSSMFLLTPRGKDMWKFPRPKIRTKSNGINAAAVFATPRPKKKTVSSSKLPKKNTGTPWPVLRMFLTGKGMLCALADSLLVFFGWKFAPQKIDSWDEDLLEKSSTQLKCSSFQGLISSQKQPATLPIWDFEPSKKSSVPFFLGIGNLDTAVVLMGGFKLISIQNRSNGCFPGSGFFCFCWIFNGRGTCKDITFPKGPKKAMPPVIEKKCPEAQNSGSLNYPFGGNQAKQMYGNFKGIPFYQ